MRSRTHEGSCLSDVIHLNSPQARGRTKAWHLECAPREKDSLGERATLSWPVNRFYSSLLPSWSSWAGSRSWLVLVHICAGFSWYHPKSHLGAQAWCGTMWDLREWDVASVAFAKQAVQVVRLSRGQLFGELALLGDQPRAASARCASLALIALVL